jgi:WD40 repeat protein
MSDPVRPASAATTDVGETVSIPTATSGSETGPMSPRAEGTAEPPLIPGFEIEAVLGRGGMGVVYRARHLALKRMVALKMILAGGHAGEADIQRFHIEAEAVARLQHPNIVQVFEVGADRGLPYCALEYVDGGSLGQKLQTGPLPPREAAKLVETIAGAIYLAHSRNIIHRDLKPANVLLTADGTPKVTDFGLARQLDADSGQTRTGAIMGTPSYMAPEQAHGESKNVGPPADVYALGVILYECLTGRPPFQGANVVETLDRVRTEEPVAPRRIMPRTPIDLETVCLKCLAKEPERRYSSAKELADDLGRFRRGEPVAARPVGAFERSWRWCRRNKLVASLGALLSFLVVAGTVVAVVAAMHFNRIAKDRQAALDDRAKALAQAESDRALADTRREMADTERDLAQRMLANSTLARARAARAEGDILLAESLLDDVPANVQQWEWRQHRRAFAGTTFRLLCHRDRVRAVDWSPDGRVLASSDEAGWVMLHDAASGETIRSFAAHEQGINCLLFSPDGSRLASLDFGGAARIWNAKTGDRLLETRAESAAIKCLAWSADGRQLVAGADDKICFVNADSGSVTRSLGAGAGTIVALAVGPDGRHLAAFDSNKRLAIWNLGKGEIERTLDGHQGGIGVLAYSPEGDRLAGGGEDESIHLWDVATGKVLHRFPLYAKPDPQRGYRNVVTGLCYRPDGQRLATCCGAHLSTRPGVLAHDRTLRIWDVNIGAQVMSGTGPLGPPLSVRYSPDGRRLISGGAAGNYSPDGDVRVWDLRGEGDHHSLGHDFLTFGLCFSPDGSRLASVGGSQQVSVDRGNLRMWDPATATLIYSISDPEELESICFEPRGQTLITGTFRGTIQRRDARTGKVSQAWTGHNGPVYAIAVSPDAERIITGGGDGKIRIWSADGKAIAEVLRPSSITSIAISPDGTSIAAAESFSKPNAKGLLLWRPAEGNEPMELGAHAGGVRGVAFSGDGTTLASAGVDGILRLWDLGQLRERFSMAIPRGPEAAVAFSPDSQRIATASGERAVTIWDVKTGQEIATLTGPENIGRCVAFSPNGDFLAAGNGLRTNRAGPGEIRVWDGRPFGHRQGVVMRTAPQVVWFAPDGKRLFARDRDGNGFAWSTPDLVRLDLEPPEIPVGAQRFARSNDGSFEAVARMDFTILFTDLRATPEELSERRAIAVPDPAWHAYQAWQALHNGREFAIAFHAQRSPRLSMSDALVLAQGFHAQQRIVAERKKQGDVRAPEAELALNRMAQAWASMRPNDAEPRQALIAALIAPNWVALRPDKATSSGGATLTIRPDSSILASGATPDKDSYTLTIPAPAAAIAAVRLETLADPALPFQASGRAPVNGNFELSEIALSVKGKPTAFASAWADWNALARDHYLKKDMRADWAIDGDPKTYWNSWPDIGHNHAMIAVLKDSVAAGDELTIRLDFHSDNAQHSLGCFRLAVTADARSVAAARLQSELQQRSANCWTILTAAAWLRGDWRGVLAARDAAAGFRIDETPLDAALTAVARDRLKDSAGAQADLKRARAGGNPKDKFLADLIAEAEK